MREEYNFSDGERGKYAPKPRVGVTALVVRGDGMTLMIRKIKVGHLSHDKWEFPGGALEFGENIMAGALRELQEETGVIGSNPRFVGFTEEHHDDYHWVTIYITCDHLAGVGEIMEPTKCSEVRWVPFTKFPQDCRSEIGQFLEVFGTEYYADVNSRLF